MTIKQIIRLLWRNKLWIILVPILVALGIYFFTKNKPQQFESKSIIFTSPNTNSGATEGGVVRMDFYTSNNMFDNLTLIVKSRETLETVSLKLLGQHLSLPASDPKFISGKEYKELSIHISEDLWEKLAITGNAEATFQNVKNHYETIPDSPIEYLLREHPQYATTKINERLFVARKASSDMMEISYRTSDPGICYQTLIFLTEAFMERYSKMKELENMNSIKYFQDQLVMAQTKLREAEDKLKDFMTNNRILNYYEQGKYLDIAKLEQDQDEEKSKRLLSGTKSNLEEIESMFDNFDKRQLIIQKIAALQEEIVQKNLRLQGLGLQSSQQALMTALESDIEFLKKEIQKESKELFKNSNSLQGVQRETILEEWLRLKILFEDQTQALEVMQSRKAYLSEKINEFAPLGAELNKLEREVEVNEEQYLSILHGLNMAFLTKYDLETSSSQKLIDVPYFPKIPLPSKRMILVAGSFIGAGFMVLTGVFVSFFLDRTIKSKTNAEENTGLKVAGGWINEAKLNRNIHRAKLENKQIKQFYNQIQKHLPQEEKIIIAFYSLKPGEGKSFLIKKLIPEFQKQNRSVAFWEPSNNGEVLSSEHTFYSQEKHFSGSQDVYWKEKIAACLQDVILLEFPNLEEAHLNYRLINKANIMIMVLDSSRQWNAADAEYLSSLKEMVEIPHLVWLNKMEGDELEDLNGEIPRTRSKMRTRIKNLVS
ncbi:MAG: Wzz/FepE/Etk N-terminal domain-containing protein [Cyclobacteriaceae bacterium]